MSREAKDQYSTIYYATLIASIGGFLIGFCTVIIAGVLLFLDDLFDLSVQQQEIVVSSAIGLAIIGSFIAGFLCSAIGRKKTIMVAAVFFAFASVAAFFSYSYPVLILTRSVLGFGMGLLSVSVPLYISEIVPANIRGSCICAMVLILNLGYLIASLTSRSFSFTLGWQFVLSTAFIPALGLFIGMCYMPETPQWLYGKNKKEQAIKALQRVRRFLDVDYEIDLMECSSQFNKESQAKLLGKGVFKAVVVGAVIAILMEATGWHAIFYYFPLLLQKSTAFDKKSAIDAGAFIGISASIASFVTMFVVDRLGRRKLLFWGLSVMFICLVLLGFLSHGQVYRFINEKPIVLVFCIFAAGFVFGLGSVGWLIISEIFPLKIRSISISSVIAMKWFVSYMSVRYFLTQYKFFGPTLTFWTFGLISVLGFVFVYYFVPETTGISLETIEEYWLEDKNHGIKITE